MEAATMSLEGRVGYLLAYSPAFARGRVIADRCTP